MDALLKRMLLVDSRWVGPHGIGRFARETISCLPDAERINSRVSPLLGLFDPIWMSIQIARRRPRVYFSPGFNPPLWCSVPFVFTIHDLIHLRFPEESSFLKRQYYEHIVLRGTHRAARVLTVSEFSKQEILEWAGIPEDRVVVVGNGVGGEFVPVGRVHAPGFPYILYVGNQKPHKNIPRLLEAFAQSGLANDIKLLMTGSATPSVSELIARLRLDDAVRFLGEVGDDDLSAYYRGALGVVLVSLLEGFGLPPLEAMACGTPVLVSNISSMPEVVGDAGLKVDPYDIEAISAGMKDLVSDDGLRADLRAKGLVRARQFSWERTAATVREILESVGR